MQPLQHFINNNTAKFIFVSQNNSVCIYFLMTLIFGLYEGFDLNSFISNLNVHKEMIKHDNKGGGNIVVLDL